MIIAPIITKSNFLTPFFLTPISAGFPSPADDYLDKPIDLNKELIKHPAATFFVRATGESMLGAGIHSNDILLVDRKIKPVAGHIIVAILDGEFTVKRLKYRLNQPILVPENSAYKPIVIKDGMDFEVWGVVVHVIHTVI